MGDVIGSERARGTGGTSPVMGSVPGAPSPRPQGGTSSSSFPHEPLVGFMTLTVRLWGKCELGPGRPLAPSSSTRDSLASRGRWAVSGDPSAGYRWRRGALVGRGRTCSHTSFEPEVVPLNR